MDDHSPLKTLFDSMNKKAAANDKEAGDVPPPKKKPGKRLSVERIYQKKTQLEHILLRPDTYIGSVEPLTQNMWVFDNDIGDNGGLCYREITFVPGLYKIFDEILVNAADNKQRDAKMDCIKITIDPDNNQISVWNNGKGIPVVEHQTEKVFVPTLIFGHLLTSSNYNDDERKVTGGRNGYGAKLCNIFSSKFTVTTASMEYHKQFKQVWKNNMDKASEPAIKSFDGKDFTEVSFQPDLSKFKMEKLDKDTVALLTRRAYDIAGINKGVKVYLNGKRLPVKSFKDYVDLYVKDKTDENDQPLKVVHEICNERWEVCITLSEKGFNQVSFVNSIATTKGGRHVDYVVDRIVEKVIDVVKKKNKGGINIRPFQIKNHIWVFVNCLVENPTFDSQTKENMTLQVKKFGSVCKLSDKFIKQTLTCGIVESIMNWVKFKAQNLLNKKCSAAKHSKLRGIPKLDDANDAGTKNSKDCTLILTEGDSAKTLAVSGLSIVGRDKYGVFPLRGKLLNVREATHKQIMENAEINNVIKIMGLQYKKSYDSDDALKTLRYGKLMIMTDQDQDGSHIKGLLVNFIHHNWPSLLKHKFLEEFITPIVKATKGKEVFTFYSLPEFEEWKKETPNHHTWRVKYYKGLGTSTNKEAKEYFSDMVRHRIPFKYVGPQDDAAITLAFSKKKTDERKEWLTDWLGERKKRREDGLSDLYLYNKDTRYISYNDFVNKELVLFSNMDNERSIPSMVDGLKPGQRKVLFTCFKRNDKREVKVAQLAGSVAEHSAYHHGEASLMGTIINLAQNFVGSNNLNLLQPIGQFGTRLHGGKDAASPRYIFTMLSPLARLLMPASDDPNLTQLFDDNQRIEPEWYCPIIPMVLVNGAEGIGTGWSTKIANYDVREIVANIRLMIDGEEPLPMLPSYKGYKGAIEEIEANRYACSGEIAIVDNNTLEITELPVRVWTQVYKETVLEPMLHGSEKVQPLITDYKEYHTDTTVKIVVKMSDEKLLKAEEQGLHKVFKLQNTISVTNSVLFDSHGCIKKYDDIMEILKEFFELRLERYRIRKEYLEGLLAAESNKLDNQARFILEKIENKIVIENKSKRDLISMLVQRGYDSDPIKAWKESQNRNNEDEDSDTDSMYSSATGGGPDFNYLLGMALWSLSKERKDELLKNRDTKAAELEVLRDKTPSDLWIEDLDAFSAKLEEVEAQEKEDELIGGAIAAKQKGKRKKFVQQETRPSPMGRRVVPHIDPSLKKGDAGKGRGRKKIKSEDDKSEVKINNDETSLESSQPLSLAERLAKKGKANTLGASKPAKKQSTLSFKPAAKKKSKKNPWESDSDEESSVSDLDSDMDFQPVIPRETTSKRTAAAKVKKYTFSDDDNSSKISEEPKFLDDDDNDVTAGVPNGAVSDDSFRVASDSDDSFGPEPVQKKYSFDTSGSEQENVPVKPKQPSKSKKPPSVVELDSDSSLPEKPKAKPAPAKKKTLGKKPVAVGSKKETKTQPSIVAAMSKQKTSKRKKNSDSDDSELSKPKKKAAPKKKVVTLDSDSDSDMDIAPALPSRKIASDSDSDEFVPKKVTKKPAASKAKAKPAAKKKAPKWDDSDEEDYSPVKAKPKAKAKKSKKVDDSFMIDDSDDSFHAPPPRERAGRARAAVKYNFGDDDEDDSDF
ncbi:DNA topoisomerase 2-alpha [Saccoglossus kowalevskii]|uniref:DNA topoisomerase 2 n=1 Tax=Saccoglossus kowalevskii TaxID=10224 RepID=A0ABM0GTY1_SACKO|nr:PREDICTED: DNA topoisomerase 2-beta [Saccoglossus kowalevskii]